MMATSPVLNSIINVTALGRYSDTTSAYNLAREWDEVGLSAAGPALEEALARDPGLLGEPHPSRNGFLHVQDPELS